MRIFVFPIVAALSENKGIIELLESHGAEKHSSDVLFKSAVEEQQRKFKSSEKSPKTGSKKIMAKAKNATGACESMLSALLERGEKLETLDNQTSQLQSDASNYADMAKQLKEKNKKKNARFGLGF